ALAAAAAALPAGGAMFLASSMTIRYADSCLPRHSRPVRVLANRGANGIDGLISTALGAAVASDAPLLLAVGDLAFLHDLGGLYAARHARRPVVILLLNDDGGGIFSYLAVGRHPDLAEPLCAAPHGLTFEEAARLFGLGYSRCAAAADVAREAAAAFRLGGVHLLEVPSRRADTEPRYRDLLAAMAAACIPLEAP
ncbi:MAG: 2-succinyl-5-enolpyruvyl-6-hydroxy-3-cyclohexene-1-carboxylic-acid synthase, partial [Candidatus Sericytochromatia bacterium]|nr:2-succinyl-5-enolpyruvyl-6-hydroxy-3-cyclohexene-1-carboxylic-acid synthase [Candidatus Tanganyikabacteria bacterium]